jgi:hypothetical protein
MWNLQRVSYALMMAGLTSFLIGAGLAFFYSSRPVTIPWLLMVVGWAIGMIGIGTYAYTFFKRLKADRRDNQNTLS